jgi:hypothetical protein
MIGPPANSSAPARSPTLAHSTRTRWAICIAVIAALAIGLLLRTLYYRDMEYKGDEAWTFEQTQTAGITAPIPKFGMPTSVSVNHPGGSIWVFLGLARLTGVSTPEGLGLACMIANSLALVLLAVFAWRCVPAAEREPWLWAVALAAVNPIHVLLHRKIWPPSIMPVFIVVFLFAWWYRRRKAGAFLWGLVGALIGNVHPAGMFLAAGFAAWAWLWDRAAVRWWYWLAGSAAGAAALVPWLIYAVRESAAGRVANRSVVEALRGLFFIRWFAQPFALEARPYLGKDFPDLLRYPLVAGRPTFLIGMCYLLLIALAVTVLIRAGRWLWQQRGRWAHLWRGAGSPTAFTVGAALWGFGIVFTLTLLPIRHYYMALAFPFVFVWFARLILASQLTARTVFSGRAVLLSLCLIHLAITAGHLGYIHENRRRPIGGEYGIPYAAQRRHSPRDGHVSSHPRDPLLLRPSAPGL